MKQDLELVITAARLYAALFCIQSSSRGLFVLVTIVRVILGRD
jgi:hypothetical protein